MDNFELMLRIQAAVTGIQDVLKLATAEGEVNEETQELIDGSTRLNRQLDDLAQQERVIRSFQDILQNLRNTTKELKTSREQTAQLGKANSALVATQRQQTTSLAAQDKIFEELNKESAELATTYRALNNTIANGSAVDKQSEAYVDLTRRVEENKLALASAERTRQQTRDSLQRTNKQLELQEKQLSESAAETRRLAQAQITQRDELQKLRPALDEARKEGESFRNAQKRIADETRRAERALSSYTRQVNAARGNSKPLPDPTTRARPGVQQLNTQLPVLNKLLGAITTAIGVRELIRFGNASLTAAKQVEQLEFLLGSLSGGNGEQTLELLGDLRGEADRLGLGIRNISRPFAEFQFAAKELNVEQNKSLRLFGLFTESLIRAGGGAAELQDTQLGLVQSIRQGNIQYDEFRQLSSRLPGAFEAVAKAFNITTKEVKEFISTGNAVFDENSLTVFIEELGKTLNATGKEIDTTAAAEGRLANATTFAGSEFAKATGLAESYRNVLNFLSTAANSAADSLRRSAGASDLVATLITTRFGTATEQLAALERAAKGANEEIAKGGDNGAQARIAEINEQVAGLTDTLIKVEERFKDGFDFGFGEVGEEGVLQEIAEIRLQILELRKEAERLEGGEALKRALTFSDEDFDPSKIIIDITEALRNLADDPGGAQKFLADLAERVKSLSAEQLAEFRTSIQETRDAQAEFGLSTEETDRVLRVLAEEGLARATKAANEKAEADRKAAEAASLVAAAEKTRLDGVQATITAAQTEADATAKLARLRADNAEQIAKQTGNLEDETRARELNITALEAELEAAQQLRTTASDNLSLSDERIGALQQEILTLTTLNTATFALVDAGGELTSKQTEELEKRTLKVSVLQNEADKLEQLKVIQELEKQTAEERIKVTERDLELANQQNAQLDKLVEKRKEAQEAAADETTAAERAGDAKVREAELDLKRAEAKGDVNEITKATIALADAEVEAANNVARAKGNEANAAKATADAVRQQAKADGILTDAEKKAIEAADDLAASTADNADKARDAAEAKEIEAEATREAAKAKEEDTEAIEEQTRAYDERGRALDSNGDILRVVSANFIAQNEDVKQSIDEINFALENESGNLAAIAQRAQAAADRADELGSNQLDPFRQSIEQITDLIDGLDRRLQSITDRAEARAAQLADNGDEFRINQRLERELEELAELQRQGVQGTEEAARLLRQNAAQELKNLEEREAKERERDQARRDQQRERAQEEREQIEQTETLKDGIPVRERRRQELIRAELQQTANLEQQLIERNNTARILGGQSNPFSPDRNNPFGGDGLRQFDKQLTDLEQRRA